MGGGGGKGSVSNATAEQGQAGLANQLTSLLSQEQGQSQQLFNLAFPAEQTSQNFYSALASGDPDLISKVLAPAAQQINQATAGAKQNIMQTAPAGGEKNLALENLNVDQEKQLGANASQGYTGSFNALAQMGSGGVSQSQGAASTAIGAGSAAGTQWSDIVKENTEEKGATMGAFGGLAGGVGSILFH